MCVLCFHDTQSTLWFFTDMQMPHCRCCDAINWWVSILRLCGFLLTLKHIVVEYANLCNVCQKILPSILSKAYSVSYTIVLFC